MARYDAVAATDTLTLNSVNFIYPKIILLHRVDYANIDDVYYLLRFAVF